MTQIEITEKKNEKFSFEMKIQRQRKKSNERMRKEQTFAKMGRFGAYEAIKTLDSPSMITSILEIGRTLHLLTVHTAKRAVISHL